MKLSHGSGSALDSVITTDHHRIIEEKPRLHHSFLKTPVSGAGCKNMLWSGDQPDFLMTCLHKTLHRLLGCSLIIRQHTVPVKASDFPVDEHHRSFLLFKHLQLFTVFSGRHDQKAVHSFMQQKLHRFSLPMHITAAVAQHRRITILAQDILCL